MDEVDPQAYTQYTKRLDRLGLVRKHAIDDGP